MGARLVLSITLERRTDSAPCLLGDGVSVSQPAKVSTVHEFSGRRDDTFLEVMASFGAILPFAGRIDE